MAGGAVRAALRRHARVLLSWLAAAAWLSAGPTDRSRVDERVRMLTRDAPWRLVASLRLGFRTWHPQGMVKIGDSFFVSSVEVRNREAGEGTGHVFKIDRDGKLVADLTLGEGAMYHPGGIDFDGTSIWVPVGEYRPDSRSIVYRVDPATMRATEVLRFADHLGAVVFDTEDRTLHGVSWGSRRFYTWKMDTNRRLADAATRPLRTLNRSHYVDYQDCKYLVGHRMLCSGTTQLEPPSGTPFHLGGLEIVDLVDGRPVHQVPVPLWTARGLDVTHNPVWIEPEGRGLRAYFMPEDDESTIYVYDVAMP